MQVLFVSVLGAIVDGDLDAAGDADFVGAGAGPRCFLWLIFGQLVLLVLLVPGIAAVAITGEKEAMTMEMLYASRLSPIQIVLGKIVAAVSYPVMAGLLSGLPFVCCC